MPFRITTLSININFDYAECLWGHVITLVMLDAILVGLKAANTLELVTKCQCYKTFLLSLIHGACTIKLFTAVIYRFS